MDGASRLFRIGRIAAAVLALGAAGWATAYGLGHFFDSRKRNLLWARGAEILHGNKSNTAIIPLQELFGDDIDGVCVVWNGPVDETPLRQASPAAFGPAITAIVKMQAQDSTTDSDLRFWVIHAVKGGAVLRTYSLAIRSNVDLYRTDVRTSGETREPTDRCFDRNVPLQLNLYSEHSGEEGSLIIKLPAEPPATIR